MIFEIETVSLDVSFILSLSKLHCILDSFGLAMKANAVWLLSDKERVEKQHNSIVVVDMSPISAGI